VILATLNLLHLPWANSSKLSERHVGANCASPKLLAKPDKKEDPMIEQSRETSDSLNASPVDAWQL